MHSWFQSSIFSVLFPYVDKKLLLLHDVLLACDAIDVQL